MEKLLTLADGDLLGFKEDHDASGGCETCYYGSSYVQDFTVDTTLGSWRFDLEQMYEYPVSHEFLFQTILPAVQEIQSMTIEGFIEWLSEKFRGLEAKFTCKKIKAQPGR